MKLRRRCSVLWRLVHLFAVVLLVCSSSSDAADTVDSDEEDDDQVETAKSPPEVLLAHVYVDSKYPEKSQKSGGLPQTISQKKAMRLLEKSPIRFYAGSTRQRLHVCSSQRGDDDFYVWYSWRGSDLKRDGYMVQVFQFRSTAAVQDVANALKQFGELDEDNPFVQFDNAQILTFLYAMAKQREVRQNFLKGVHVFLQPWRRMYSEGMTEDEMLTAKKVAQTIAEETGTSALRAPARIRTAPELATNDANKEAFHYVVIEEDSDFGSLYDQVWSLASYVGYDPGTRYAQEWGKQAIYKFLTNTTATEIKAGIRAFHSGKITGRRLEALLQKAWPTSEEERAMLKPESSGPLSSVSPPEAVAPSPSTDKSTEEEGSNVEQEF